MGYKVAVVGATGNVGREILQTLAEREFPVDEVVALASERSVGREVSFGEDQTLIVQNLAEYDFAGTDIGLFSPGSKVSAKYAPKAAAAGCIVIDNTSEFRMDEDVPDKMRLADERTLVIAQIESGEGARNARRIAAVEGVDVLWIGHFDLANFLGIPAQFDHPDYRRAEDAVRDACEAEGKTLGRLAATAEEAQQLLDGGYGLLAVGLDVDIYRRGLARELALTRKYLS